MVYKLHSTFYDVLLGTITWNLRFGGEKASDVNVFTPLLKTSHQQLIKKSSEDSSVQKRMSSLKESLTTIFSMIVVWT